MEFCDIGHRQVCYEEFECPACKALEKKQNIIDSMQDMLDDISDKISNLEAKVTMYETSIKSDTD